jgi:GMP synthase-like glutamine amidotransferase
LLTSGDDEWHEYHACDQQLPAEPNDYHAFVVTGSRADAHDEDPWIVELKQFCLRASQRGQKFVGVCFGHQLLSRVFGGHSHRAPDEIGWYVFNTFIIYRHSLAIMMVFFFFRFRELGVRDVKPSSAFATFFGMDSADVPAGINMFESHRDQVLQLPPGATLLASSARCPVEMYGISNVCVCCQGHPEMTPAIVESLAHARFEAGGITQAELDAAVNDVHTKAVPKDPVQSLFRQFLHS